LGVAISLAFGLLLGLFLALAVTVQTSVLRPLWHFRERVEQLGRGEFRAGSPLRGPTEIVTLAESFDLMATDLQSAEAMLRRKALEDELTGLGNRHALVEELARLQDSQREATVIFIDLDNFKTVNDSLGHSAGDALLAELAARLRATIREGDVAIRLGGDEFAVLLVDTSRPDADRLSHRLLDAIKAPVDVVGFDISSTASIGIADSRSDGYDALLRNADIAMYAAKAAGKGQVAAFHDGLHTNALTKLNLAAELRRAYERSEFRLHYQPILRNRAGGGEVAHVEALLRWQHPERGLLGPGAFLAVAEELPLMQQISSWVLRQALLDLRDLRELQPDLGVAVNVTANQLRSPEFVSEVLAALAAAELPASSLILELTERDAMDDDVQVRHLAALRRQGVTLALDDFGTGYSSLAALRWLPVDILKIDRSFVGSIENGPQDRTVVQATIAMAHALGLVTVADGVETPEQDQHLNDLSCDYLQGYLHARPMAPDAVAAHLERAAVTAGV
jgi:diguanylate cyclase (GGDEF)-like protein